MSAHPNGNKSNSSNHKSICNGTSKHKSKPTAITTQSPSKSHSKPKKKRHKSNHNKHTHAPILIFPYSWNSATKDEKCKNNKQFHKKSKPMSARIPLKHGIDHLLSPSKCSKRYLSAYALNLHQLTSTEELLNAIIKKLTPVIKQLQHITNAAETDKDSQTKPVTFSPTLSPIIDQSQSPMQSPPLNPINESESPMFPASKSIGFTVRSMMNLKVSKNIIANSLPSVGLTETVNNGLINVPQSTLDMVETRSCPDLDTEYNNISDENATTPPKDPILNALLSSKSVPHLFKKIETQTRDITIPKTDKKQKRSDYKSKMKAYCIATVKHNIDIIYHWVYYYPSDFAEHTSLDKLLHYITKVRDKIPSNNSINRRWSKLLQLIQHRKPQMKYQSILSSSISNLRIIPKVRKHDRRTSFQFTDSFFPPREMVQKLGGGIDLLHIHPALVADQLTLIDTEIFLQIKPREFTNQAWQNRPNLEGTDSESVLPNDDGSGRSIYDKLNRQKIEAPNLLYMIDHVNRLSLWVATEILSRNTTAEMADLTKYFYVVAHRCLELCNIHTCTAIFGGISLQPLTRLRRLNRYLSDDQQIQQLHRALSEMVSSNHNYKTYRNFMDHWYNTHSNTPCIPFIPVVMKDLFQIQLNLVTRAKLNSEYIECKDDIEIEECKCIDLGLLEKNCRHIRRVYETQQKAKLYANQLPADTDVQSKIRMNIAKFETQPILRAWSFEIQPKLTKEDKENLEMIDTLEEFGFL